MITSEANRPWPCDVPIADLDAAGLSAPSVVRPWKLATIDRSRILRICGRVGDVALRRVNKFLAAALGV